MHGIDYHTIVDFLTLVGAVGGAFLASRRDLLARLSKIETTLAKIEGALKASGLNF